MRRTQRKNSGDGMILKEDIENNERIRRGGNRKGRKHRRMMR
jgi:hypothetical protein